LAISGFSKAIELKNNDGITYYLRAHAYHEIGDYEQARKDANLAVKYCCEDAKRLVKHLHDPGH